MKSDYLIWASAEIEYACRLHQFFGLDDPQELNEGVPFAEHFPCDAKFTMDLDFPYNVLLTDNLVNTDLLIVASSKIKTFLEKRSITKVEYLPVTILNHKQRAINEEYFIIHPIDPVDCLDMEKCGPVWSSIDPSAIESIERLVLDAKKIDQLREIFRPKFFYDVTIVKRELAATMDKEGFTNNLWIELEDYSC